MTDTPDWLTEMRAITGMSENPGEGDEPKILAMRDYIAKTFPDMASYCSLYKHDATPWCGLAAAYCMARAGIRPPFGKTDTDRFLWARAWGDDPVFGSVISAPRPGCVVVMTRSGGGHVTFYESTSGSSYKCRGGNQSDAVNVSSYPKSSVLALVWPRTALPDLPELPEIPDAGTERRTLQKGDSGPDVMALQKSLALPADGEFGPMTDAQVKAFQAACRIDADGVVGPMTWGEVSNLDARMLAGSEGLSDELQIVIEEFAAESPALGYIWKDRGTAPPGYIAGMALGFAVALTNLVEGNSAVELMARPLGGPDTDALKWFAEEFLALGYEEEEMEAERLRQLWVLLTGLGMRESSGRYYVGKDASATNTTADTCEAGLFQTSWNISKATPEIGKLLPAYWLDPTGFLPIFKQGLVPTAAHLAGYGGGDGARYQFLAKFSPLFACMTTAIGLRTARKHWGPVNRKEVELLEDVDDLFYEVQKLIERGSLPPEPEGASVDIVASGNVIVTVNGKIVHEPA